VVTPIVVPTLRPPYPISALPSFPRTVTGTGVTSENAPPVPSGQLPPAPTNGTRPSCTVNVPQADLAWWYEATYRWPVAVLTRFDGNFTDDQVRLTRAANTDTFDVTNAMSEPAYTNSAVFDAEWDVTWTYMYEYTVKPAATITSVVSRSAYIPLPSDIVLENEFPLYEMWPDEVAPASVVVPGRNGTGFTA
jgi:hypothetical protein